MRPSRFKGYTIAIHTKVTIGIATNISDEFSEAAIPL